MGDFLIKKLLYQSKNRGCKETDAILGSFAEKYLSSMTHDELLEFENILSVNDTEFYDWYTKKRPISDDLRSDLLDRVLNFEPFAA